MLKAQIMFKQLHQLQEIGESRHQNYVNQLSAVNKQAPPGVPVRPLFTGTPIQNSSNMFTAGNSVQHRPPPITVGFSDPGLAFPGNLAATERSQPLDSLDQMEQKTMFYDDIKGWLASFNKTNSTENTDDSSDFQLVENPNQADDNMQKASSEILFNDSAKTGFQTIPAWQNAWQSQAYEHSDSKISNRRQANIGREKPASWINHPTFKHGQILPMYDIGAAKRDAKPFGLRKPNEYLSIEITNKNPTVFRPKKRKFALPCYYKELSQASPGIQNISEAEEEWARATNRLTESVECEGKMIKRPKKRLILTTNLMQQLFRPVVDSASTSDSIVYFAARTALGDACCSNNQPQQPTDTCPVSSKKHETADFSKVLGDLVARKKKLEDGLIRFEERAKILDLKVEYQELEKFSVINRLAKFHARGAPKALPRKYVKPLAMPSANLTSPVAQGHVIPFMELSQCLIQHGYKITFVNTDFNHKRVMKSLSEGEKIDDSINLVSIPDGLEPLADRNDLAKLCESAFQVMPRKLEELIEKINGSNGNKISCIIADHSMGWALEVAEKMGIRRVAFWPAAAAMLALTLSIPKLVDDGIINENGTPTENQIIRLSPTMPAMNTANFIWACIGDLSTQKIIFQVMSKSIETLKLADLVICNSAHDLEPAAFEIYEGIIPIGPLPVTNRLGRSGANFWPEDSACLKWLDQQPPKSVIYVAFGSFTIFDNTQFKELALGLELSNKPFLWVVRPDITDQTKDPYPEGFMQRVRDRSQMVGWAPQQRVLSHPSVACFLSHCGWNSTIEGVSNGVPFLCWPYFADQFCNQGYICDVWKVGLGFERDESGIIVRDEIRNKVEYLLGDEKFRGRALDLKEKTRKSVQEHGCSHKNFSNFIGWLKEIKHAHA